MTPSFAATTERVRQAADLPAIAQHYGVELRRVGKDLVGKCPFHQERTPSFSVSPASGLWNCFGGCGGGDVFTFVRRIEGLSFPETIKLLANHYGIPLDERPMTHFERDQARRRRIYDELLAAEAFWFWRRYVRPRWIAREIRYAELARGYEAFAAGEDSDDLEFSWSRMIHFHARRERWARAIGRLDAAESRVLARRYERVRPRWRKQYEREKAQRQDLSDALIAAVRAASPKFSTANA